MLLDFLAIGVLLTSYCIHESVSEDLQRLLLLPYKVPLSTFCHHPEFLRLVFCLILKSLFLVSSVSLHFLSL